jgi:DNA-directed RNA polymerase specialized sigma24 family protein
MVNFYFLIVIGLAGFSSLVQATQDRCLLEILYPELKAGYIQRVFGQEVFIPRGELDDFYHDVLLAALGREARVDNADEFTDRFYRTLDRMLPNEGRVYGRGHRRISPHPFDFRLYPDSVDNEELSETERAYYERVSQRVARVNALLDSMAPDERQIFDLILEDVPHTQIKARLRISESVIRRIDRVTKDFIRREMDANEQFEERKRFVLSLIHVEGFNEETIAEKLGLSPNAYFEFRTLVYQHLPKGMGFQYIVDPEVRQAMAASLLYGRKLTAIASKIRRPLDVTEDLLKQGQIAMKSGAARRTDAEVRKEIFLLLLRGDIARSDIALRAGLTLNELETILLRPEDFREIDSYFDFLEPEVRQEAAALVLAQLKEEPEFILISGVLQEATRGAKFRTLLAHERVLLLNSIKDDLARGVSVGDILDRYQLRAEDYATFESHLRGNVTADDPTEIVRWKEAWWKLVIEEKPFQTVMGEVGLTKLQLEALLRKYRGQPPVSLGIERVRDLYARAVLVDTLAYGLNLRNIAGHLASSQEELASVLKAGRLSMLEAKGTPADLLFVQQQAVLLRARGDLNIHEAAMRMGLNTVAYERVLQEASLRTASELFPFADRESQALLYAAVFQSATPPEESVRLQLARAAARFETLFGPELEDLKRAYVDLWFSGIGDEGCADRLGLPLGAIEPLKARIRLAPPRDLLKKLVWLRFIEGEKSDSVFLSQLGINAPTYRKLAGLTRTLTVEMGLAYVEDSVTRSVLEHMLRTPDLTATSRALGISYNEVKERLHVGKNQLRVLPSGYSQGYADLKSLREPVMGSLQSNSRAKVAHQFGLSPIQLAIICELK